MNKDDKAFLVRLIDECSKRGAFRGDELQNIGYIRGKLLGEIVGETPPKHTDELQLLNEGE
jgi:hypothetical protein